MFVGGALGVRAHRPDPGRPPRLRRAARPAGSRLPARPPASASASRAPAPPLRPPPRRRRPGRCSPSPSPPSRSRGCSRARRCPGSRPAPGRSRARPAAVGVPVTPPDSDEARLPGRHGTLRRADRRAHGRWRLSGLNAVIRAIVRKGIDGHGHAIVAFATAGAARSRTPTRSYDRVDARDPARRGGTILRACGRTLQA